MQRIQRFIGWACVSSEVVHVFCCGLPMVFSLLSLLSGIGLIASMPVGLEFLHHLMHDYEIPMIMVAGFIISIGWGVYYVGRQLDCRVEAGCHHQSCTPKKKRSARILVLATLLFAVNVTMYFTFHHG